MEEARQYSTVNLVRQLSLIVMAAGIFGFLSCFGVDAAAQRRLAKHPEYSRPSAERTVRISVKIWEGYVEPDYARRLKRADDWFVLFWPLIVVGGLGWSLTKTQRNEDDRP